MRKIETKKLSLIYDVAIVLLACAALHFGYLAAQTGSGKQAGITVVLTVILWLPAALKKRRSKKDLILLAACFSSCVVCSFIDMFSEFTGNTNAYILSGIFQIAACGAYIIKD